THEAETRARRGDDAVPGPGGREPGGGVVIARGERELEEDERGQGEKREEPARVREDHGRGLTRAPCGARRPRGAPRARRARPRPRGRGGTARDSGGRPTGWCPTFPALRTGRRAGAAAPTPWPRRT